MKVVFSVGVIVLATLGATSARADESISLDTGQASGLIDAVYLLVRDEVTGGCWTTARAAEENARQVLEGSNIAVIDASSRPAVPVYSLVNNPRFANVVINAYGARHGGTCLVTLNIAIYRWGQMSFDNVSLNLRSLLYRNESVALGKSHANSLIDGDIDRWITDFAVTVLTARDDPDVQRARALLKRQYDVVN